jgi:hypothetical protein
MTASKGGPRHHTSKPGDATKKLGGYMVGFCLAFLIIGRAVVSFLFPELRGQGIPPAMLFVLIPVWSIGVVGLVLLLAGWIRGKNDKPSTEAPTRDAAINK